MRMENLLAKELLEKGYVYDEKGNEVPLAAAISLEEGVFIQDVMKEFNPRKTIEIGCAYGISSLFICEYLKQFSGSKHFIIDPGQNNSYFKGIGVANLKRNNIDFFELIENGSEVALPKMLGDGEKFDLAFIDGYHTFDHTLIDLYYTIKMLKVGGVVIIDDVSQHAVNKALRYVLNFPCIEIHSGLSIKFSNKRKLLNRIKNIVNFIMLVFPAAVREQILDDSVIRSDKSFKLESSMIALKKVSEDKRDWNWYQHF